MQYYTKILRTAGLVASTALAFTATHAADAAKPAAADKDALPVFENSVTIAGQGNWATGDKAAFQAENWTAKNGFGGIEDFQFSKDIAKDVSLKADGHLLAGSQDYLAHINVAKTDIGSVDVGYKRFRTYYDNAGGFFLPTDNSWLPIFPQELAVDRSKLWVEANLTLPNAPIVTLRYTNELRNGRKDSTIWGPSDFTGMSVLSNSNANLATRYIAPGYLELGERHQTLEGLVKHKVGDTTLELSVLGDRVNNLNTRVGNRYPGEVKLPAIPAAPVTTVDPTTIQRFNNAVTAYDRLGNKADTSAFTGKIETVLSETAKFHAGLSYQLLNSDFTEDRPLYTTTTSSTAPVVALATPVIVPTSQALNLVGNAKIKTYTANTGVDFKVQNDFTVELGVKGEDRYATASDTYQTLGNPTVITSAGIITPATPANIAGGSRVKEKTLVPEIAIRYTGIKNISLYGTSEYRYVWGDERVTTQYNVTTVANPVFNEVHENHGRYTVGANWAPCTFFSLRGETFYKDHENNFQGYSTTYPNRFVLGYKMKGTKLTATVKPLPTLTFTTRYVYQTGKMQTSGYQFVTISGVSTSVPAAEYQSMDARSHNIGETIDWTPIKQFYMQANLNIVFDTTSTAYPRAGVSNVTTVTASGITLSPSGGNDVLRNADNNYSNGSLIAGFVVDKATNAEVQYTYYKADNYQPALVATGLPYGASEKNYSITVGIKRKLTDRLIANLKVGYMDSKNDTTGGRTDYTARIAYVSLQQAF